VSVAANTNSCWNAERITSSGGNVSSWSAGTWNMPSSGTSGSGSSTGGSSNHGSSWVPQWAAQQINAAWSYVERVISSNGGAPEEGMPSSSMDSEAQEHLQTWQAGSAAPGQLSWATVLPQAIPQGLRTLQSKVPQLLAVQKHDLMQLPVTMQHAYQLTAEAAEAGRACSSGECFDPQIRCSQLQHQHYPYTTVTECFDHHTMACASTVRAV
jgi:hypothetical protein